MQPGLRQETEAAEGCCGRSDTGLARAHECDAAGTSGSCARSRNGLIKAHETEFPVLPSATLPTGGESRPQRETGSASVNARDVQGFRVEVA